MWLMQNGLMNPDNAGAASTDYMHLFGLTALTYMWARIAKTVGYLESFSAADFEGADTREVTIKLRGNDMSMPGLRYLLPLVPLWHEKKASDDAISYLREKQNLEGEKEAYRTLYPAYGTYLGGSFAQFVPNLELIITAAAVIPGHIVGRWKAAHLEKKLEQKKREAAAASP